jgi:hypothetical protein
MLAAIAVAAIAPRLHHAILAAATSADAGANPETGGSLVVGDRPLGEPASAVGLASARVADDAADNSSAAASASGESPDADDEADDAAAEDADVDERDGALPLLAPSVSSPSAPRRPHPHAPKRPHPPRRKR